MYNNAKKEKKISSLMIFFMRGLLKTPKSSCCPKSILNLIQDRIISASLTS
jgi:hypothetical protein